MSAERPSGPVLTLAVLAVVAGGAAGWAWRLGEARSAAPLPPRIDPMALLLDRQRALRVEAGRLRAERPSDPPADPIAGPRTWTEYVDLLERLRRGDRLRWKAWAKKFELVLAADIDCLREFLVALETPGERRELCLALLAEFSPAFLTRPELIRIALLIANDEAAGEADRAAVLALPFPCWGAEDPCAWDTLARLAQFARSERVREAATARLTTGFAGDARTRRLLEERWWRETEPAGRATSLAATLAALDGAGQAELIARAAGHDASPEVCEVAASQVLLDVLGGSERPMDVEQRRACCAALFAKLSPAQPLGTRRQVVAAVLAAGALSQVETLLGYLERQEPDAALRAWALDVARRIRDTRGERDDEVMRILMRGLEPEAR